MEWAFADDTDRTVMASREMLEAFLNLDRAPDETFDRFARRWGVLGVCWHQSAGGGGERHGRHELTAASVLDRFGPPWREPFPLPPGETEPDPLVEGVGLVDQWERLAVRLAAALRLWRELDQGSPGEVADWASLWDSKKVARVMLARPQAERTWFFEQLLATWLRDAHVQTSLAPMSTPAMFSAHPAGLDGGLLAMVYEAGMAKAWPHRCDACKRLYLREGRAPRSGERNYCDNDRQRGPWRFAQANRRADMSEEERVRYRRAEAARKRDARAASAKRRETGDGSTG
jgi:hypothetical protein